MLAFSFLGGDKVRRFKLKYLIIFLIFAAFTACTAGAKNSVNTTMSKGHPSLSAQDKLTPCATCHKDVTPDIYKEWYDSVHGIANVKCFQCHGTYEDFATVPKESSCAACHNKEFTKKPKDKACWSCHPAHHFYIHK